MMTTNQIPGVPPWRVTKNMKDSSGQNLASDLKVKIQNDNSSHSPVVADKNEKNTVDSPTTHFTIRSSVSDLNSPCNGEAREQQCGGDVDQSERISFAAAFNMFESSTLPKGTKNRRNFSIPKNCPSTKFDSRSRDGDKRNTNIALKSPSIPHSAESTYPTLPGSPKKSSAVIVLSSANGDIHKHSSDKSSLNNTSEENASLKQSADGPSTSVRIKSVTQPLFRSHGTAILPSPPPQASYSPSNNIQWPLVNKNKYVFSLGKKSHGSNDKTTSEVTASSSKTCQQSPAKTNITNKLDSSKDNDSCTIGSLSYDSQVNEHNEIKPGQTAVVNGQKPASCQGTISENKTVKADEKYVPKNSPKEGIRPSDPGKEEAEASSVVISTNQKVELKTVSVVNQNAVEAEQTNGVSEQKLVQDSGTQNGNSAKSVTTASVIEKTDGSVHLQVGVEIPDDEKIKDKLTLKNWDPRPLLKDLYQVKLEPEVEDEFSYINMEGYMEKLPTNKKKATLLKTWKRRYFKAKDGKLYYFESQHHAQEAELSLVEAETAYWEENSSAGEKASAYFQMMGGSIEELGGRMLGIDDGRGRYLVVRCPTDKEYSDWLKALNSQISGNIESTFVKPVLSSPPHSNKKVVIIDIGSCSVRAGILGEKPSLPSVFFPTVVAVDKNTGEQTFGIDCYRPDVRATSTMSCPVRPSNRMDKSVDMTMMTGLFRKIYNELGVNPKKYWVMFSAPGNLSDKLKEQFMNILIKEYLVPGVNIVNQTLLALYSYNAKTGIVVDIGDRLEIVPITDGYVAEGGVTKQPYGGHRVADALKGALTEQKYHFFTEAEYPIVRLIMERLCFVSENFEDDMTQCSKDPKYYQETLSLKDYNFPEGYAQEVTLDWGRFKAPEGLFNTEVWGMDNPPLQKLVQKAIQASPLDLRREMWRSIYLSGGATVIPGFSARLQAELNKIAPSSIVVQVHASPQRYHAAYIGACTLASLPPFERSCITAEEWNKQGAKTLKKWHMY